MKIERSISFAFKAPNSTTKLALGGVFSLLFFTVFFGFVVMGYAMRILCDALEGRDAKLPDWSDLKGLFNDGVGPALIIIGYNTPLFALYLFKHVITSFTGFNLSLEILLAFPSLLLMLTASLLVPVAIIRYVVLGSIGAALQISHGVSFIRRNPAVYLTAWGVAFVFQIAASFFIVAFVVGFFFAAFIAIVISTHLFAQAYRSSTPFSDDVEGELRASAAIPPPLVQ